MSMNPVLPRVVIYEGAGATPFAKGTIAAIMTAFLARGCQLTRIREGASVSEYGDEPLIVTGNFLETLPALDQANVSIIDATGVDSDTVIQKIDTALASALPVVAEDAPPARKWKPWFPVIDYDRCTNCMQCLSFCLFDVYGVSKDKKIEVRNQDNCKTDCPACSRVCPEVAILFPKYKSGPINGAEVDEEDIRREGMKVDITALLGGDIYAMLRDRSAKAQSRFSKERDEERALKERQRCLVKLKETLDIPDEVLASLPSMEQIQAKAERAITDIAPGGDS
jgi:NAD-dependent dihydropyrimidine dehydrogenase PreA subunit